MRLTHSLPVLSVWLLSTAADRYRVKCSCGLMLQFLFYCFSRCLYKQEWPGISMGLNEEPHCYDHVPCNTLHQHHKLSFSQSLLTLHPHILSTIKACIASVPYAQDCPSLFCVFLILCILSVPFVVLLLVDILIWTVYE